MVTPLDRDRLFADQSLVGTAFCRAYARRVDDWLAQVFAERVGEVEGISLAATGGYGQGALSPQSDLDIMLVHEGLTEDELADLGQKVWYPIWDEGLKLGHSIRTPKEALKLAREDLDTATSLVPLRHLAGDELLTRKVLTSAREQWRKQARKWLPRLAEAVDERRHLNGEVAFLLEPDLKKSGGGLRDVNALRWAEAAGVELLEQETAAIDDAHEVLMAARVELHRSAGRLGDVLLLEEQDAVTEALGIGDADELMSQIAGAARTVSWIGDDVWARARKMSRRRLLGRSSSAKIVGDGLVLDNETIHLVDAAPVRNDPSLVLRAAVAAAENGARIDRDSLDRMVEGAAPIPEPWDQELRDLFARLLLTGRKAIPVIEALDQTGEFVRLVPEWEPTRSKPQRNAYHRFTVDRHLCEAACEASWLADQVERPDLLVVGALLHDIGKGYPGDHTIVGMDLVDTIATRMGYSRGDVAKLVSMVEHHLLLPDVATRRDIEDEETIALVADQVGSVEVLHLLGALTEADSIATGPSAWSSWKSGLVNDLVRRTERLLEGQSLEAERVFPSEEHFAVMSAGEVVARAADNEITVIAPDVPGLFSRVAGALAIAGLDIRQAQVHSEGSMAAQSFLVEAVLLVDVDWSAIEDSIMQAIAGEVAIGEAIGKRIRTYGQVVPTAPTPMVTTHVVFDNDASSTDTVIEMAAPNQLGLLYRVTSALARERLDIRQARVQTLGEHVVDSFYVQTQDGAKVTNESQLASIEFNLLAAVETGDSSASEPND